MPSFDCSSAPPKQCKLGKLGKLGRLGRLGKRLPALRLPSLPLPALAAALLLMALLLVVLLLVALRSPARVSLPSPPALGSTFTDSKLSLEELM